MANLAHRILLMRSVRKHLLSIGRLTRLLIVVTCVFAGLAIAMSYRIQTSQEHVVEISGYNMEFAYTRTQVEILKLESSILETYLGIGNRSQAQLQLAILAGRLTTIPVEVGDIAFPEAASAKTELTDTLKEVAVLLIEPVTKETATASIQLLRHDSEAFTALSALANARQAEMVERAQDLLRADITILNLLLFFLVAAGILLVALVFMERIRFAKAAETDALTGLSNRMALKNLTEFSPACGDTAIALIDVDHFKQVNDRWGHAAGDDLLRLIADVLRRHTQACDLAVRLGGDEFLLVAFGPGALTAIEDCCAKIKSDFAVQAKRHDFQQVALSIGTAHGDGRSFADIDILVGKADAAMYDVKRGRSVREPTPAYTQPVHTTALQPDANIPHYRHRAPQRRNFLPFFKTSRTKG